MASKCFNSFSLHPQNAGVKNRETLQLQDLKSDFIFGCFSLFSKRGRERDNGRLDLVVRRKTKVGKESGQEKSKKKVNKEKAVTRNSNSELYLLSFKFIYTPKLLISARIFQVETQPQL